MSNIARNDLSRAFLFKNGIDVCQPTYTYFPCLGVDALTQDFGDVTRIECPDPYNFGRYIEVGNVGGEISRMTTTLTTRLSRKELSLFREFAVKGCGFDLHLHFGLCQKPNDFNAFDKMLIFEDVFVTSYGTDALSALQSADRETIMETIDITIGRYTEIVPLTYAQRAANFFDPRQTLGGITYAGNNSCGADCDNASDGCEILFTVTQDGKLLRSVDAGQTWQESIHTWQLGDAIIGPGYLNGTVFGFTSGGIIPGYTIVSLEDALADNGYSNVDIPGLSAPIYFNSLDVGISKAIVTSFLPGFAAVITDPVQGFDEFYSVSGIAKVKFRTGSNSALMCGLGVLISYIDGEFTSYNLTGSLLDGKELVIAYPLSDTKFLVGDDNGNLYCSTDATDINSWTEIKHPYSNSATRYVREIQMIHPHIIYVSVELRGMLISYDGGASFNILNSVAQKSDLTFLTTIEKIIPCESDINKMFLQGRNSAGSNGVVFEGYSPGFN